jgi:hypothetical protein
MNTPANGGNKQSRDWWRKRKLAAMSCTPAAPPYNGGNKQSQCQRRLARHRQLELMEAAASGGTAPPSPNATKNGDDEHSQYERKLELMEAAASGTAPSPNAPKNGDNEQSQYERKLTRLRQLVLMEEAASGPAPSMKLDVSSFAETNWSYIRSRNGVSTPQRHSITEEHPDLYPSDATENITSPIFDQRRHDGDASFINLMDHRTGIYK